MDLSALESALKALEASLDSLAHLLMFWTALVVVGLAVEYHEDFKQLLTGRPRTRKRWPVVVGGALITIGVAGELGTQFKASRVETDIRSKSHQIEGLLDVAAGGAQQKAKEAGERAESADLARVQLEAILSPRRLSLNQQQAIANSCRRFAGRRVIIMSYAGDAEAMVLAEQIRAALHAARIEADLSTGGLLTAGSLLKGVQVSGPNEDFRVALESSLKNDGHLEIAGPKEKRVPEGSGSMETGAMTFGPSDASIFVGVKPPVLLPLP